MLSEYDSKGRKQMIQGPGQERAIETASRMFMASWSTAESTYMLHI